MPFDSECKISEALRQVDELRKELAVVHDKHKYYTYFLLHFDVFFVIDAMFAIFQG